MEREAIRIVVADDNLVFRISLRWLLDKDPRFKVVGEAGNGLEAVAQVIEFEPDVVLLDVNMPVLDGIQAARIIASQFPAIKIVVLTMHDDPAYARSAIAAGASAILTKGCSKDEILDALWCNAIMELMPVAQPA